MFKALTLAQIQNEIFYSFSEFSMKKLVLSLVFVAQIFVGLSQQLFDPNAITAIDITFSITNWDAVLDQYYAAGLEQRLTATVVINGQTFEGAGVKFKGNSTYGANNAKNPMNIKLDYTTSQSYDGFQTLKLSNGQKDPSWVRETLTYEILRKYMQAPKSNYAWVTINGSPYGLMCNSESVNSDFIDSHFYSDNDNTLVKCNPASVMGTTNPPAGCTVSNNCSLQFLGSDSACYYNYYEMASDFGWSELQVLAQQISTNFSNHDTFLDRDRFIWMMAMNNVLVNLDSYTGPFVQNYYLYKDDHGIFNPVMWDFNQSLGSFSMINGGGPGQGTTTAQLQQMDPFLRTGNVLWPMLNNILAEPTLRRMYVAHCKTILEENFVNGLYIARAQANQDLITAQVQVDPNDFYTLANMTANLNSSVSTGTGPGGGNVVGITQLMEARSTYMMNVEEFTYMPPAISEIQYPVSVIPGASAIVTAHIVGGNGVIFGYRSNESTHFSHNIMQDDGMHNDGVSGDGIFGFVIPVVPMGGIQYFIYAENNNAGIFSPQRAEKEFYCIGTTGGLVLNEFQANNISMVTDGAGEYEDWIELYNSTSSVLNLSDFYVSDELNNPGKFQLPSEVLNPGEYFILWCDEEQAQGSSHANFKLASAGGETITLANSLLQVIDAFFLPSQEANVTYGRFPNGNGPAKYLQSTFGVTNSNLVSVNELLQKEMLVYPNPANDQLNIILQERGVTALAVMDMTGNLVSLQQINGSMLYQLDTSTLAPGAYIVKAGNVTKSFMKL